MNNAAKTGGFFSLDEEATAPSPITGVMTEFVIVHVASDAGIPVKLYDATPHPDNPALPVVRDGAAPNATISYYSAGKQLESVEQYGEDLEAVTGAVTGWLTALAENRHPVLVFDHPAFDGMWMTCFFDALGNAGALWQILEM